MKTLIYVPVIHTSADLGSLAKDVTQRGIADLGEDVWEKHKAAVEKFWDVIADYFTSVDVSGIKVYQDGMIAEGEIGQRIVEEGAKAGSRNYQLISRLLKRGAILVKTEDFKLVKLELDKLRALTQAKTRLEKIIAFIKYRLFRDSLLNDRDKFIVERINETLHQAEKGIIFIGACHNIKKRLPKHFQIVEIKDAWKVKEYQRLLPFYRRHKNKIEELSKYLVSSINREGKDDPLKNLD